MKIALICSLYSPDVVGGAEKVVQVLAEGLAERGHQVNVLTTAIDGKPRRDKINGVSIHRIQPRNLYPPEKKHRSIIAKAIWHTIDSYNPFAAQDIKKWLKLIQPEIVNTHVIAGFSTSIWKETKALGISVVHTLHDQYILCPRTTMFRDNQICQKQCLSCQMYSRPRIRASRHVDTVIGVSQFILEHHRKFTAFPKANQVVIYNGIKRGEPSSLRRRLIMDDKPGIRFGFLGKINESKGIQVLIDAFLNIEPNQAELWIAGKGLPEFEEKLKQQTKHRNDIQWLGFINSDDLLNNIDVLVLPSVWNDTAPLVIHEAFSFGVSVIGSRRGGIAELVSPQVGWLFEPNDPANLIELLREVIQNRKRIPMLSTNTIKSANNYTSELMISNYLTEFEQLVKERR